MTRTRQMAIVGMVLVVAAIATALGVSLSEQMLVLSPLAALVGAAVILFLFAVITGRKWPVFLVFIIAILVFNTAFRPPGAAAREAAFDSVSFLRFGVFFLAFAIGLVGILKTYRRLLHPPGIFVFLYWCVALLSVTYSRDSIYTLAAAFGLLAWIVLAITMAERFTLRELLISVLGACAIFIWLSWGFYLWLPELGQFATGPEDEIIRFIGLAGQPNAAGQVMAIYIVALVCLWAGDPEGFRRLSPLVRALLVLIGLLALVGLVLSQSRGSTLGLLGALLLIVLHKARRARFALVGVLVTIPLITVVFFSTTDPLRELEHVLMGLSRTGSLEEITTFTGRTDIWAFSWEQIMNKPVLGHGYGTGQALLLERYTDRWGDFGINSAHNALLHTMLDLGFVGGAMLAASFAHSLYRMFARPHLFRDAIFILVFVFCLLESGISKAASVLSLIWIVSLFVDRMPQSADAVMQSRRSHGLRQTTSACLQAE